MVTIAICDDSKTMVEGLQNGIARYAEETGNDIRIFTFYDGVQLLEDFNGKFDIIFLDIKMPGMNGLAVSERIRKRDSRVLIIFLTSLVEHALEGYKVNAANYIIKPIGYKRLKMELDRWILELGQEEQNYIIIHNDSGNYKIILKNISYVETYNRNIMIHAGKGNILSYLKLKEVEEKIGNYGFARCHSSYIVNLFYVENIEKMDVKLSTGERIPISKTKKKEFMEKLAAYWGSKL